MAVFRRLVSVFLRSFRESNPIRMTYSQEIMWSDRCSGCNAISSAICNFFLTAPEVYYHNSQALTQITAGFGEERAPEYWIDSGREVYRLHFLESFYSVCNKISELKILANNLGLLLHSHLAEGHVPWWCSGWVCFSINWGWCNDKTGMSNMCSTKCIPQKFRTYFLNTDHMNHSVNLSWFYIMLQSNTHQKVSRFGHGWRESPIWTLWLFEWEISPIPFWNWTTTHSINTSDMTLEKVQFWITAAVQ